MKYELIIWSSNKEFIIQIEKKMEKLSNVTKIVEECDKIVYETNKKITQSFIQKVDPMMDELKIEPEQFKNKMTGLINDGKWYEVHKYTGILNDHFKIGQNEKEEIIKNCVKNGNGLNDCTESVKDLIQKINYEQISKSGFIKTEHKE